MTIHAIWEVTLRGEHVGVYATHELAKLAAESHAAWSPDMHWEPGTAFRTPVASLGLDFEVALRVGDFVPVM